MSKVLITGGAGFIGSNLAEELVKTNSVRILDNITTGNLENLKKIKDKIEIIKGDIRDFETVKKAIKGTDYIFHLAALVSVPESIKKPIETNNVNVSGTLNILSASKELGVKRVIFTSSCAVYGNTAKQPIKENSKLRPESPYALTKLIGEEYCKLFSKLYNLETVSLRCFNVYGPKQNPKSAYAAVIPKFISEALRSKIPTIYGDGNQTRDFVFVKDVVNANILAMKAKDVSSQVFNIGSGRSETVNELLEKINKILNKNIKPKHAPQRPGDVKYSLADISKVKKFLGYSPKHGLEEGLKETIKWFRHSS